MTYHIIYFPTAILTTRIGLYARPAAGRAAAPENGEGEEVPPKMSLHHHVPQPGLLPADRDGGQPGSDPRQTDVRQHDLRIPDRWQMPH